jgi:hypothetical protein
MTFEQAKKLGVYTPQVRVKEIFEYEQEPFEEQFINEFDKSPNPSQVSLNLGRVQSLSGFGFEL